MEFFILFMILILVPKSATAQPKGNITLGSSLAANSDNSTWKSPSGEFAFGFRQIVPGSYLLAIWFDKIPEKTILWSANRDNPAQQGSRIQLLPDGRFQLQDPSGQTIWAPNSAWRDVAYAAMLDTGDFVLASNVSEVIWQSFDEPTDTLLPSQILKQGGSLVSSFSGTNYSSGRFKFILQSDGNLVSYIKGFPKDNVVSPYWATGTSTGFQLIFNQSGYIYLTNQSGDAQAFLSSDAGSSSQFYQRAILEYDGVLRHYVYPKSASSRGSWSMAWSVLKSLPSNICTAFNGQKGSGACGYNSFCTLQGPDPRPICSCPVGYKIIDPNDRMSGCKQDFALQNCGEESQETDLFIFTEMPNTDWVNGDYDFFDAVSEEWCRQACLGDCFCAAARFKNNVCWLKRFPLSNGRIDPSAGGKALLKIRQINVTDDPKSTSSPNQNWNPVARKSKSRQSALIIILSVLLGGSVFMNLLVFSSVLLFAVSFKGRRSTILETESARLGVNVYRSFSFAELQEATDGFKEELGRGACSIVYKGILRNENERLVAVKKLDKMETQAEQEFKAEVSTISRTNHKNLVQLLGYCDEGPHKLLVYEFMSNGSLSGFLFANSRPSWDTRVQIALAAARGLSYLHEECSAPIIHCDIKPQNILLDESLVAKISDFGLAKLLKPDQTRTNTGIRGTKGYVAPEWFRKMPVTAKVDVYSFGVLLLELLCCRRSVEKYVENENEMILSDWAYDCYREGQVKLLVGDDEEAMADIETLEKWLMVALWCIQDDPCLRPNMKRVLLMLEGSVEVPIPPDPDSFFS